MAAQLHPRLPRQILPPLLRSFDEIARLALGRMGSQADTAASSSSSASSSAAAAPSRPTAPVRVPTVRDLLKVCKRLTKADASSLALAGGHGAGHGALGSFRVTSTVAMNEVVPEIVDVCVVGSSDEGFVQSAARSLGAIWSLSPEAILQRCTQHRPSFRTELIVEGCAAGIGAGGGGGTAGARHRRWSWGGCGSTPWALSPRGWATLTARALTSRTRRRRWCRSSPSRAGPSSSCRT